MSEAYIRRQITIQEQQLGSLHYEMHVLENRLDDLYQFQRRANDVLFDFDCRQQVNSGLISQLANLRSTSRIASRFQDGMGGLLSGGQSRAARYDLINAIARIDDEIRSTSSRIDSIARKIVQKRNFIDSLYRQLQQMRLEMQRANQRYH